VASALKSGKAMIGRPVVGKTVKAPSFAMTIPLRDAQGKIIGALTGATDLTKPNFLDSVDAANYGRTGGYLIVDSGHRLFVTATQNNKNLVMQLLPEPGVNRVLDQRLLGFDGSAVNINSLGKEVLTTSGRIPAAGWFVISTLPTEEPFEPIRQINLHLYEAAGLASLLAICIAWWSMSRLLSPLQKAAQDVSLLAEEGASNTDLPIARMDEVGKLIDGFNRVMRVSTAREKALRESENQIRQLAFHDALTQLPNRRLMIDRLEQAILAGKRTGKYCAFMFIDMDNFKPLNDTYGHETGDQMLLQAAQRLTACVRAIDTVARFGGDEFVVLISDLASDHADSERRASEIAEKIRGSMSEPYRLRVAHGTDASAVVSHVSTASIGVALFKGGELGVDDVLHRADTAMYQAKVNGRNLVRFHHGGTPKTMASSPKSYIDTSIDLLPPAAPT
jgi:diguanylate cyclase (GGDEF)-like protein